MEIRIGISSCLLGQEVRFDGGHKRDPFLTEELARHVRYVPLCPEVEIGLGVPRPPIRLARVNGEIRLVDPASGADLSERMRTWSRGAAQRIAAAGLDGYVLKKSSPSCGLERVKVYDENGSPAATGRGLFAEALLACLPLLAVEEEGRLRDPRLRERFVERAFGHARVREFLEGDWTPADLVEFHSAEKMLVRAHDPSLRRASSAASWPTPACSTASGWPSATPSCTPARSGPRARPAATRTCSSTWPATSSATCRAPTAPSSRRPSRTTAPGWSRSPFRWPCCAATCARPEPAGARGRPTWSRRRRIWACAAVYSLTAHMVVAIDGPAGAGKSTVARAAAQALGFTYLDSGAMYRAVGLMTLRHGGAASEQAEKLELELGERVIANGEDVTEAIRTPEVSEAASRVAVNPRVREALAQKQRDLLAGGDWVAEGRDIGSVVAPDAAIKVFLTASPEERARRRAQELGTDASTVLRDQALRDAQDSTREHSPLRVAPGAIELDTTGLSVEQVVERIAELVAAAR